MNNKKGILFVVSGPSGAGKGTIMKNYFEKYPNDNSFLSISMTSRKPRPMDEEGVTYYFKTREVFEELIENGGLAEWTEFCGNYYGTPKKPVLDMLDMGKNVVLEIEVEGGKQVRESFGDTVGIFVMTPSIEELKNRLVGRNTESEDAIDMRIKRAYEEMAEIDNYDYLIINDDPDIAVDTFRSIMIGESQKVERNKKFIQEVCKKC